jgi:uncharacterized protein (TIGR02996 family)
MMSARSDRAAERDLRAAIRAAPDDDTPRLVYADWLLERGDAHGELIAVQCELARLGWKRPPRWYQLRRRERELLGHVQDRLAAPVLGLCAACGVGWRRGMVEEITIPVDDFLRHGPALLAQAPIRAVTLGGAAGRLAPVLAVLGAPAFRQVAWLRFAGAGFGDAELCALADAPALAGRRGLAVRGGSFGAAGIRALARSPHLGGLERLEIADADFGDGAAFELAAGRLTALRRLLVPNARERIPMGPQGAGALAGLELATGLEQLDVSGHPVGDAGVAALVSSDAVARLRCLDIAHTQVGAEGLHVVASSRRLAGLERLRLADSIGDAGARALVRSRFLPRDLHLLVKATAGIGRDAWSELGERFHATRE